MLLLTTKRMFIFPISIEQLQAKIKEEPDEGMKQAYSEMLDGCVNHPEQHLWYTVWMMQLKDGDKPFVGDLCFKGLGANGTVEIGYGVKPEYEGKGLMTEAVIAAAEWASAQPGVIKIEAETEDGNTASKRVLEKAGFVPNGVIGEEGPRFELKKR